MLCSITNEYFQYLFEPWDYTRTKLTQHHQTPPPRNDLTLSDRSGVQAEFQAGLLERDSGNIYLTRDAVTTADEHPSNHLLESSITYRIAVGPQQGRKVMTLQTLADCEGDQFTTRVGNVAGFSLHAAVATKANERAKLERLCRYIKRPAVSTKRLSITRKGRVRYELNQK